MFPGSKYPKQFRSCNDTCTACGLLCCQKVNEFVEDDVLKTKEEEAESHFLWQHTVDKLVENLNGNWSWASAGLFATAFQATISLFDSDEAVVVANWIYFIVVFLVGVAAALIEHSFESPETIAMELELKVPQKKAALGDKKAIKHQTQVIQKAARIQTDDHDRDNVLSRIMKFVQIEVYSPSNFHGQTRSDIFSAE